MRKFLIILGLLLILSAGTEQLDALVKVKAKGSVATKNKKPKTEERQQAILNGQQQALRKYASGLDSQRLSILNELMPELLKDIEKYILDTTPLNDGEYQNGNWEINLEVSIDDAQIEQLVRQKTPKLEEHFLSFVYVAREVASVEFHEGTVSIQADTDRDHFKLDGSIVMNSEGISYRSYNPAEIDSRVTEIFNKAGFDVVPAFEVNLTPEQFAYDFITLDEISNSTQKEATDIARDQGLEFLALGTLDIGREEIDPVTGQYKIYAKVGGYIMDLRKKFAVKICSVGPLQYSGLGPNPTVAKTNALIEAATKASQDLVDQLRVKLAP